MTLGADWQETVAGLQGTVAAAGMALAPVNALAWKVLAAFVAQEPERAPASAAEQMEGADWKRTWCALLALCLSGSLIAPWHLQSFLGCWP